MKKIKFRPSRLATFLAACVAVIFALDTGIRLMSHRDLPSIIVEDGNFLPEGGVKKLPPTPVSDVNDEAASASAVIAEPGYTTRTVTKDDIYKGKLVSYKGNADVITDSSESRVNLAQYGNDFYTTLGDNLPLNKAAADGLNDMMEAYYTSTNLTDFAVYGTEATVTGAGSPCPIPFSENKTGNTVDLAVMGYGSVLPYDGKDIEKWVVDNCSNYGYVVRYPNGKKEVTGEAYCPWHLRYVGMPHSLIMNANNLCLEEYVKYIQQHTKDNPVECNVNSRNFEIYSVPSMGDVTYISVPLSGNYEISGDGSGGYIITIER